MTLKQSIMRHEGLRLAVYDDATGEPLKQGDIIKGHPTIGYGRLLSSARGITKEEALYLLENDIALVKTEVTKALPWVMNLNQARRDVLFEMAFQMGVPGLLKFKNTLAAVKAGDYAGAAEGMKNSLWARQTPSRAKELSEVMLNGQTKEDL